MPDWDTTTVDAVDYATISLTDGEAQAVGLVSTDGLTKLSSSNPLATRDGGLAKVTVACTSLTTATTLYTAGDQVGSAMQFQNVSSGANGFFKIVEARQRGADAGLHPNVYMALYDASPTGLAGNNSPMVIGLTTAYLGFVGLFSGAEAAITQHVYATGAAGHLWGVLYVPSLPAGTHFASSTSLSVELIVQKLGS